MLILSPTVVFPHFLKSDKRGWLTQARSQGGAMPPPEFRTLHQKFSG